MYAAIPFKSTEAQEEEVEPKGKVQTTEKYRNYKPVRSVNIQYREVAESFGPKQPKTSCRLH